VWAKLPKVLNHTCYKVFKYRRLTLKVSNYSNHLFAAPTSQWIQAALRHWLWVAEAETTGNVPKKFMKNDAYFS
jgi:hypothetical protein